MALVTPPNFLQAGSYGASGWTNYFQALMSGTGVIGSGDLAVSALGSPNMSVNVAQGQVIMPGTLGSTGGFPTNLNAQTTYGLPSTFTSQGAYESWNNATTNLVISAANPTNPRIDLVCASTQDAQYSGSNNQAILQVITGTPAASPSPPSSPANTVVLAQVLVPANATSITTGDITDERPFMSLAPASAVSGRMYPTGQTILSSGTAAQITSLTTDYARGGVTIASNTLTVPVAGLYLISAAIQWQANSGGVLAAGNYATSIYRNGGANYRQWWSYSAAAMNPTTGGSDGAVLAAGDTLTLYGYQGTGSNEATSFSISTTWLSATLITATRGVA